METNFSSLSFLTLATSGGITNIDNKNRRYNFDVPNHNGTQFLISDQNL